MAVGQMHSLLWYRASGRRLFHAHGGPHDDTQPPPWRAGL